MKIMVPSERNFDIYNAVTTAGKSLRTVAALFELSLTRVQQIVDQVRYYLSQFGSQELLFSPPRQAELAALRLTYEKLRYIQGQLMREWDASLAKANGESSDDALSLTRSKSQPNIKLVQQAVKVSIEQTKLAGRIAKVYGELHEQGEVESLPQFDGCEVIDDNAEISLPPVHNVSLPPAGGCTELSTETAAKPDNLIDILNASSEMPTLSDLSLDELKRLKRDYDRRRRSVRRE